MSFPHPEEVPAQGPTAAELTLDNFADFCRAFNEHYPQLELVVQSIRPGDGIYYKEVYGTDTPDRRMFIGEGNLELLAYLAESRPPSETPLLDTYQLIKMWSTRARRNLP